jgi:hypothetical protein
MSDWYTIEPICVHGMQDTSDMDGLYISRRILPIGSIVPLEWKGRQRVNDLYLPATMLADYTPVAEDMALLYMLWPAIRPLSYKAEWQENSRIGTAGAWASGWYQIKEPDTRRYMTSVPYGVSALMDIEGICKAGDIAMAGDIVPAPFFAGLSIAQFDRLETIGLCSTSWLANYAKGVWDYHRNYARPTIARVGVSASEKAALLEKYPAMNPQIVQEIPKVKTIKKRG